VPTEATPPLECTAEPPLLFTIAGRVRLRNGVLVTLRRVDEPYPPRDVFITSRELKMGYENVYKGCFVCVDRGLKENAIALPKGDVEAGLPP
jgi:hypothetical protein